MQGVTGSTSEHNCQKKWLEMSLQEMSRCQSELLALMCACAFIAAIAIFTCLASFSLGIMAHTSPIYNAVSLLLRSQGQHSHECLLWHVDCSNRLWQQMTPALLFLPAITWLMWWHPRHAACYQLPKTNAIVKRKDAALHACFWDMRQK